MTRPDWQAFAGRVTSIIKVWRSLVLPNGGPNLCSVTLLKREAENAPEDAWRERGRTTELDPPGGVRLDSETGGVLGKIAADKKVQLKLYQKADAPEPWTTVSTPDNWGVIQLILDKNNKSSRVAGSPNKWRVQWNISHGPVRTQSGDVTSGSVLLEIAFDEGELPELKDWPVR
jgi:hypothetical protein